MFPQTYLGFEENEKCSRNAPNLSETQNFFEMVAAFRMNMYARAHSHTEKNGTTMTAPSVTTHSHHQFAVTILVLLIFHLLLRNHRAYDCMCAIFCVLLSSNYTEFQFGHRRGTHTNGYWRTNRFVYVSWHSPCLTCERVGKL